MTRSVIGFSQVDDHTDNRQVLLLAVPAFE